MSRVDLYPQSNSSPSSALVQTGTSVSGSKVAADVFIRNSSPIPVTMGGSVAELFQVFNEISAVAIGVEQTILTYTVPIGFTLVLCFIAAESDCVSVLRVKEDGATISKNRISFGGDYSVKIDFQKDDGLGLKFSAGTIITVTGYNSSSSGMAEFSARLVGYLE